MSTFIHAIDNHMGVLNSARKIGENGHIEYTWNIDQIQERIVQFHFQCVRCSNIEQRNLLKNTLNDLLYTIKQKLALDVENNIHEYKQQLHKQLVTLFKMIGQCRDITSGKGERDLSYMMICCWYKYYPEMAKLALRCFVNLGDEKPYGSWKDMKLLCQYVYDTTGSKAHPIIEYCMIMMCEQLKKDSEMKDAFTEMSLCARWIPREKSKYSWLFKILALMYFPQYTRTAKNVESISKAVTKTYMTFARFIAGLNKILDTVQIKMCGGNWAAIDHNKTTSVTLIKNRAAFMNQSKKRGPSAKLDRIKCADNFEAYVESCVKQDKNIKGSCVGIIDFVKNGYSLNYTNNQLEKTVLNSQWDDFMTKVGDLGNMVVMADQSGSMLCDGGDPYYACIGLSIAIAKKSVLGSRVMTFSTEPAWVSLDGCNTFTDYIYNLQQADSLAGMSTNFFKSLKLILDSCIAAKLDDNVVSNMVFVILSDMQINEADTSNKHTMFETIKIMYNDAGYSKIPHILFWNLRSTNGFPSLSSTENTSMLSGFSPVLLNVFCKKGIDILQHLTPWSMLVESLAHERYDILERELMEFLEK